MERATRIVIASLLAVSGSARAAQDAQVSPPTQTPSQPAPVTPESARIQFNFKDAPFDQVVDFFSRECGLPVIFETTVPEGAITFISGADYSFDEALTILNLNMARAGVRLRRDGAFLYLASIEDSARKASRVERAAIDPAIAPDEIITLTIPLDNARADVVAEQIKPLIGKFGSVTSVPQQNMVVVVESAAQARRIREIVGAIDAIRPADAAFRLFPLAHAQADVVLGALRGLMGERQRTVVIDKDGQQRVVQDQNLAGLNLAADARTNAIVAVGPEARIRTVEEVIRLLDVPEGVSAASKWGMSTFALVSLTPAQAETEIAKLFRNLPEKSRPLVIPLEAAGKLSVIGSPDDLARAAALIRELEPDADAAAPASPIVAEIIRPTHANPAAIETLAERVLTPRQRAALRRSPTPDGRGLLVVGPEADVKALAELVRAVDRPDAAREVRLLRLTAPVSDVGAFVRRVQELDAKSGLSASDPVDVAADQDSRTLTLVGSPQALARFEALVSQAQAARAEVEARTYPATLITAEELARRLRGVADAVLPPGQPRPDIEPIEGLDRIVVRASPEQTALIEQLVRNLDTPRPAERPPLRILQLRDTDAANLAQVLQASFDQRPAEQRTAAPVVVQADAATNTLIVSAHDSLWPEIERIVSGLNDARQLSATDREIRIFPLKIARAEELALTIDQMFPDPPAPLDPRTRQPRPDLKPAREVVVRADRGTNSLIVDAPSKRLAGFEELVRSLDQQQLAEPVEVRTYRVRAADLNGVASTIRDLASRNAFGAARTPGVSVAVTAEPGTRTLVISGPRDIFPPIEALLAKLDTPAESVETDIKLFPLRQARADRLQPVVQRLLSARLRERLVAQGLSDQASSLDVASDPASNTLIITAPRDILTIAEGVLATLDQASVAAASEVRVFRLSGGKAETVAPALAQAVNAGQAPGAAPVTATPEASSNSIVVVGTSAQVEAAATLLEKLDAPADPEGLGVRSIPLSHARAAVVAPLVEELLKRESPVDRLPDWARAQVLARGTNEPPPVRVAADARTNAIVVSGPQAGIQLADELIRSLDLPPADAERRAVALITLRAADASELAATLSPMLEDDDAGAAPAVIRVDRGSNALIIRGTPDQIRAAETLARSIDQSTLTTSREFRTLSIDPSRADADLIAKTLQRLLDGKNGVKVRVVPASQLLREHAPGSDSGKDESPRPSGMAPIPRGWQEQMISAFAAAALAVQPPADEKPGAEPDEITIAVDEATNTIVVLAPPRIAERVARLAETLQSQIPPEPGSVHLVPLPPSADVAGVASLVNQTLAQIGRASPTNPGGLTGPVTVTPDPAGGSLIVFSNATDFDAVGGLIASMLRMSEQPGLTVKVYPLSNVGADRARRSLADFVSADPRGFQARRVRAMDLTIRRADGGSVKASIDPTLVRVVPDALGSSLIVAAPAESIPLIDEFIAIIDQSAPETRLAIRRYELKHADAAQLGPTFQQLFEAQRQGQAAADTPQARIFPDARTNAFFVVGSEDQHARVAALLSEADARSDDPDLELAIIPIRQTTVSAARRIIEEVMLADDPGRRDRLRLGGDDATGVLVVRARPEEAAEVRGILERLDSPEAAGLPVRSIKLARADASAVAAALTRFFADRAAAQSSAGRRAASRIAVLGDKRSGTLVVAAGDDDFEQIQSLASMFDAPADVGALAFKIIPLRNARVADIEPTLRNLADQLAWERATTPGAAPRAENERLLLEPNARTNSLVLMGAPDAIAQAERVIAALDQAPEPAAAVVVRSVPVGNADLQAVKNVLDRALATPGWRPWRGPDPDAVAVEVDRVRRALVLVGRSERVDRAASYIAELDASAGRPGQTIESITLAHARADRAAGTLRQFFAQRAEAQGLPANAVSIIGSPDGNVLMLAADADSMKLLRDLVAQIDQPQEGEGRRFEVYALKNITAQEAAATLRAMFPQTSRTNEQIIVTPQPSTGALIVSAPEAQIEQITSVVAMIDAPPDEAQASIATITLSSARAAEIAQALRAALPPGVKVTITPVARSNSILLTGSQEAIAIAADQVRKLDAEPLKSLQVFRRMRLEHAAAEDVFFTLRQLLRNRTRPGDELAPTIDYGTQDNTLLVSATAEQMDEIAKIVAELDVPAASDRRTEFVRLQFADAAQTARALELFYGRFAPEAATPGARAVTILPDAGSNSLVISAGEREWEGLKALLARLDTEENDTSRQLAVIPLRHADAASVARAISEGLRAPLEEQVRQERQRRDQQSRARAADNREVLPAIVLGAEGVPSVSAEPLTNALVVFAGRRDLERIEAIVAQLDLPGFANLPTPTVIPLKAGKATQIAATLREMFIGRAAAPQSGPRAISIVGDDPSGALIVRAEESQLAQIRALAEALTQSGENARLTPTVLRLKTIPAARLRQTLLATFQPVAQQLGETFAVEADRGSNALVVVASPRVLEQVRRVVEELDAREEADAIGAEGDAIGQSVTIIDLKNNAPDAIKRLLDEMGLNRAQSPERPGVVAEPVQIVALESRQAVAVVAAPADARVVQDLVRALDAAPVEAEQKTMIVSLRLAAAPALVQTLQQMLSPLAGLPPAQQGPAAAAALAEQLRRLSVTRNGLETGSIDIDLSKPVRLIPDPETNSVIISSTPGNVVAISEVIRTLDTLPIGEAVVVRIFPLQNAAATRVRTVIEQLFTQGEQLRRIPGTRRQGLPTTATGQALAGELAVTVDERTNALIVAGREEALALVEVLVKDLDSDRATSWVEPAVIPLTHADAGALAEKLSAVLVRGLATTPEAMGLQRQFARLRVAAPQPGAGEPRPAIAADLFAPVTGLVLTADLDLNALVVVGTPANLAVVRELVKQLDVEAAGAGNAVRVYPLQFAAAERVSAVISDIFRQRERPGVSRPEDRLIISADTRTNALLITTSPRSFAIVEALLKTLDGEQSNFSVGLHVVPVEGALAAELAPKLERLMRERLRAAQRVGSAANPLDAFSIEAEPDSNLLIIAASDENLAVIRELMTALTTDAARIAAAEVTELIPISKGSVADVARQVEELYVSKENQRRGDRAVSVLPNERLGALLVSGTRADIDAVRELVARFDDADVTAVREVRRIELASANALEVVSLLENVLAGRPIGGRGVGARQATKIRFLRESLAKGVEQEPSEAEVDGLIREQITLTPDIRTNSVLVNAPPQVLALVAEMIADIDQSAAGLRRIETIQLRNADARSMAELLRDTFNLRQQGNSYVLVPAMGVDEADAEGPAGTTVTPVPDERRQLSIAIDARTNTIIVTGTREYLELVRTVVADLDSIEASDRDRAIYHLRNAKAKEIEATLRDYFSGESSIQRQTLGPDLSGSLERVLEREVTVVGDEKSNKLIISTSPRYMEMVLKVVEELDSAPPQVMIEVLLAEVTLDDSDEWGMDISVGPFGGDNYQVSTSAATTGVLATGLGVPNLSVSSADFGLLVRALQAQGKLEVLSNPQVMVNNNEPAKIQVGDNIAVVEGVERLPQGNIRSDVQRRDVGIILNVTPSISNDGFVRMDINPEISALTARTTQISEDFQAPVINQRTVETTVTIRDGQSVVIGGLIQSIEEERNTKVPILGDIPILGLPFQTVQREARKTELLVILTPRVIPGATGGGWVEAADQATERALDRLQDTARVREYLDRTRAEREQISTPASPAVEVPPIPPAVTEERRPSEPPPQAPPAQADPAIPDRPTPYREVPPSEPGPR